MRRPQAAAVYLITVAALAALLADSPARGQLLPDLTSGVEGVGERLREQRLEELAERRARQAAEAEAAAREAADVAGETIAETDAGTDAEVPVEALPGAAAIETVTETVGQVTDTAGAAVTGVANSVRAFVAATDPAGAPIEADTLVALLDAGDVATLEAAGFTLVAERALPSLGRTMATLRTPAGSDLAAGRALLRQAVPSAAIDFNHLYRWDAAADARQGTAAQADEPLSDEPLVDGAATAPAKNTCLRIGVIDSAVQAGHRALAGIEIVAADFVLHEGAQLETHGTAIVSLIARSAKDEAVVYAASVFFKLDGYAPGATSESLVAALDWLAGEGVDVINMSLSGPGNALLEAAIAAMTGSGHTVVAAVGNAGPSSPPQYPAAYDGVIGVTAVDRDRRVFRAANRGEHVDFAALGVDVKVADSSTGSYRLVSGTSMASPHVAVVAALLLRENGVERDAVTSWLMTGAEDLGRKGFDPVYGHGLITRPPVVVSAE